MDAEIAPFQTQAGLPAGVTSQAEAVPPARAGARPHQEASPASAPARLIRRVAQLSMSSIHSRLVAVRALQCTAAYVCAVRVLSAMAHAGGLTAWVGPQLLASASLLVCVLAIAKHALFAHHPPILASFHRGSARAGGPQHAPRPSLAGSSLSEAMGRQECDEQRPRVWLLPADDHDCARAPRAPRVPERSPQAYEPHRWAASGAGAACGAELARDRAASPARADAARHRSRSDSPAGQGLAPSMPGTATTGASAPRQGVLLSLPAERGANAPGGPIHAPTPFRRLPRSSPAAVVPQAVALSPSSGAALELQRPVPGGRWVAEAPPLAPPHARHWLPGSSRSADGGVAPAMRGGRAASGGVAGPRRAASASAEPQGDVSWALPRRHARPSPETVRSRRHRARQAHARSSSPAGAVGRRNVTLRPALGLAEGPPLAGQPPLHQPGVRFREAQRPLLRARMLGPEAWLAARLSPAGWPLQPQEASAPVSCAGAKRVVAVLGPAGDLAEPSEGRRATCSMQGRRHCKRLASIARRMREEGSATQPPGEIGKHVGCDARSGDTALRARHGRSGTTRGAPLTIDGPTLVVPVQFPRGPETQPARLLAFCRVSGLGSVLDSTWEHWPGAWSRLE